MDDVPLTHCKETSTNSPTLTTPIVEHNKIMTPRRQTNHHQLHGHSNDLSSHRIANHRNKFYGGMSSSGCGTSSSINSVCGNTFTCDAMVGTRYIYRFSFINLIAVLDVFIFSLLLLLLFFFCWQLVVWNELVWMKINRYLPIWKIYFTPKIICQYRPSKIIAFNQATLLFHAPHCE